MPKSKPVASLSGMVENEMEDGTLTNAFPTPDSNQENGPAKKKGRQGKANARKFAKPKTRRSGDGVAPSKAAPKQKAGAKRAPLKEQKNARQTEDTEEVDEFDAQAIEDTVMSEPVEAKQPAKRKAPEKKAGRPPKKAAVEEVNTIERDGEFEYTPTTARQTKGIKKTDGSRAQKPNSNKYQLSAEPQIQETVIPETQVSIDTEPSGVLEEDQDSDSAIPQSVFKRTDNVRAAGRPRQPPAARKRAGSASDTEKVGNDPSMRRKLGDMTRKFENIELKYKTLKDTVAKEAEQNSQKFEARLQARAKGEEFQIPILIEFANDM